MMSIFLFKKFIIIYKNKNYKKDKRDIKSR